MLGNALYKKLFAMVLGLSLVAATSTAFAGGDEDRFRTELIAAASFGDISGQADFRNKVQRGRRQFSVQVEGLSPGTTVAVMVAGTPVGFIPLNNVGVGELNYDDNFEAGVDDPLTRFPGDFPEIVEGVRVDVGALGGNFEPK